MKLNLFLASFKDQVIKAWNSTVVYISLGKYLLQLFSLLIRSETSIREQFIPSFS